MSLLSHDSLKHTASVPRLVIGDLPLFTGPGCSSSLQLSARLRDWRWDCLLPHRHLLKTGTITGEGLRGGEGGWRLDWTGLDWTGLDWTGLGWAGLGWTGLDWPRKHEGQLGLQRERR